MSVINGRVLSLLWDYVSYWDPFWDPFWVCFMWVRWGGGFSSVC